MSGLSGGLPRLAVSGRRLVLARSGTPVLLRGVNRSGLEYAEPGERGFLEAAGITREEIATLAREWNCDILRLPFNQDWALRGRGGFPAEDYLRALDRVIAWAAAECMYTLLDLQWLQADQPYGPNRQFIAPLPDAESATLWDALAGRYGRETAVLYDLYTEPHDVSAAEWSAAAQRLAGAVWRRASEAVVFVSGTDWGYDLRRVHVEGPGVVYSAHVYPSKTPDWASAFGVRAAEEAVFAGEWGGEARHRAWGRALARYFDDLQMGWCAWGWPDKPKLRAEGAATPFGELVREGLRS